MSSPASAAAAYTVGTLPSTILAAGGPVAFEVDPPAGVAGPVSVAMTGRGYGTPVVSTGGDGVQTYTYALPVVGSALSFTFDPATGAFGYAPDADDRFDFTLEFEVPGQDGLGLPIAQQVNFVPRSMPAEQDLVSSSTDTLPDPESADYVSVNVTTASQSEVFNYATRSTRTVQVSGKTVVIAPGHANGLYERFTFQGGETNVDVASLVISAERVVIGGHVRFPSTDVFVQARELAFVDAPGVTARLDTTPVGSYATPGARQNGAAGMDGGDVNLTVAAVTAPLSGTARIVARGGRGQPGGAGVTPPPGTSQPSYTSFTVRIPVIFKGVSSDTFAYVNRTFAVPAGSIELYRSYDVEPYYSGGWRYRYKSVTPTPVSPIVPWPERGADALPGGTPGRGGAGGAVRSFVALPAASVGVDMAGGAAGQRAATAPGAAHGTPNPAYVRTITFSNANVGDSLYATGLYSRSYPGTRGADAPAPTNTAGPNGTLLLLPEPATPWLTPGSARAMLAFIKDAYLAGNVDYVRAATVEFDTLLAGAPASGEPDLYDPLRAEVQILRSRAEAGLDYFGNPAGWTPMLSFVANLSAYQGEIDSALRIKFLAGLVARVAARNEAAGAALRATLGQLDSEVTRAKGDLNANQNLLPRLQQQADEIAAQVDLFQRKLLRKEQELLAQARENLEPPFWKRALGVLGVVAQIIPIGQPVLGAVGLGLSTIATLSSKPLEAAGQIAGVAKVFKDTSGLMKQTRDNFTALSNTLKPPSNATAAELKAYTEGLAAEGKKWAGAVKQIGDAMQPYTAPRDAIEAELAKLKAADPTFNELVDELTELNAQKEVFARELANSTKIIGDSIEQITANQQTALVLARELSDTTGRLDREVVEHVHDMGRRADERLLRYQYYMAKAYEYETLRPYTGSFQLAALNTRIANVVGGGNAETWLNDPANFATLKAPYEDSLRSIASLILTDKNTLANGRRSTAEGFFVLTPDELATLNGDPDGDGVGEVTINLGERDEFQSSRREAMKIVQIKAQNIEGTVTGGGVGGSAEVELEFVHGGTSLLRDEGRTFRFRHHRGGSLDQFVGELPIPLGVTRKNIGLGQAETHDKDDAQQLALLSYLLPGVPANAEVLYAQPSVWGDVRIRKFVEPSNASVQLASALFKVDYTYENATPDKATLTVRQHDDGVGPAVAVRLGDTAGGDLSGRADGRGSFRRTYPAGTQVTLTAEPFYGGLEFDKWVNDQGAVVGQGASLSRTLTSTGLSVRPVYVTNLTPSWLAAGAAAAWDPVSKVLAVTGSATITGDPSADAPIIVASVAGANLTIDPAAGGPVTVGGITLSNGASVTLADGAAPRVLVVGAGGVSVSGASTIDLMDNTLVVRGGSLPSLRAAIIAGYRGGDWRGAGLSSSTAAADGSRATGLGYATLGALGRNEFEDVASLSTNDVVVRNTYYGDTNLDRLVNTDDILNILAAGKLDTGAAAAWYEGDMTFDGRADTDDILQILAAGQLDKDEPLRRLL